MSRQIAAILPDLATYQHYLEAVEIATGKSPWQPSEGCTNGTDFALVLPFGQESLVPNSYTKTKEFSEYSFNLPTP